MYFMQFPADQASAIFDYSVDNCGDVVAVETVGKCCVVACHSIYDFALIRLKF